MLLDFLINCYFPGPLAKRG